MQYNHSYLPKSNNPVKYCTFLETLFHYTGLIYKVVCFIRQARIVELMISPLRHEFFIVAKSFN